MQHPFEKIFQDLDKHIKDNAVFTAAVYNVLQQKEAEKQPAYWRGGFTNLVNQSNGATVLVGHNEARNSVAIANTGPSAILLCAHDFDPNEAIAQYNSTQQGLVMDMIPVPVNGVQVINAKAPVFAVVVTPGSYAAVSLLESLYRPWQGGPGQQMAMTPGQGSRLLEGQLEAFDGGLR